MANKKVEPSEWYEELLPLKIKESEKMTVSQKNVLAALCFEFLAHTNYAKEHDGWFFCKMETLEKLSTLKHTQFNRIMDLLEAKRVYERIRGTNHKCTNYRLHPKIIELLKKDYDFDEIGKKFS